MQSPGFNAEASVRAPAQHYSSIGEIAQPSGEVIPADCESSFIGCMVFSSIFAPFLIPACYADFYHCAGYKHPSDPTIRRL